MPLLCSQNKGYGWSFQVARSCYKFVWPHKPIFTISTIVLVEIAKCSNYVHHLLVSSFSGGSDIVCVCIGMIAHGHGDVKYAHYGLDFYPGDANHTVGSFAKLLRDLEKPPVHSSRALFDGCGTTPLYEAVLAGKEVCMSSLPQASGKVVCAKPLPPTLHVQLDNCAKNNKCRYVFCFWSLLVAKNIFKEVFVSFLMVGHTHDDIDASFGR
jgi:hypothetical protein